MKICHHGRITTNNSCRLCNAERERIRYAEKAEREQFYRHMIGIVVDRFAKLRPIRKNSSLRRELENI